MFKEILKKAVDSIPGARGAIFADWEGESVEHCFYGPDDDIKLLGAHQGILLNLLADSTKENGQGRVLCMLVSTEGFRFIVQPVKDGYFLVILLSDSGNGGIALKVARDTADILMQEI